ncbi:MAG: response regulator transcription factor [Bacteroidales bacterium]|nr:response regulator transcription factor [Bacteroidales bacterium]MCF8391763.1 response regulator transcription factor [Bacteroidales bacterium]
MEYNYNKILVVDDEEDIVEFISYNLIKEGYDVSTAKNGWEAINQAKLFKPHLILLDIMMPEMDGIEACEEIRSIPGLSQTLIAFLSARSEDYTQIAAFNAGADGFIAKPIRPKVLTSTIKALLKRYSINHSEKVITSKYAKVSDVLIDKERHLVTLNGKEIDLPKKEFNLLSLLLSKPSRVFTREEIFDQIWGADVIVSERTIDVYIRKIREKIGVERIKTVKGVGYKFIA